MKCYSFTRSHPFSSVIPYFRWKKNIVYTPKSSGAKSILKSDFPPSLTHTEAKFQLISLGSRWDLLPFREDRNTTEEHLVIFHLFFFFLRSLMEYLILKRPQSTAHLILFSSTLQTRNQTYSDESMSKLKNKKKAVS